MKKKQTKLKQTLTKLALLVITVLMLNPSILKATSVLVYGPMLSAAPNEATIAAALGYTVTVVTDAQWQLLNATQFASYNAIIIPDDGCQNADGNSNANLMALNTPASKMIWSPLIKGRFYAIATDPLYHRKPIYQTLLSNAIQWVASGTCTGLYYCSSCNFNNEFSPTAISFLSLVPGLAGLQIDGQTAPGGNDETVTILLPGHATMNTVTNADLSNWNNFQGYQSISL